MSLELIQEVDDLRLAPIYRADKLASHNAIAVDDVSLGKLERAVESVALLIRITDRHKVDLILFKKLVISIGVDINAHSDHRHTFIAKPLLELDEGRHFLYTRRTPGGPEIQDHGLAMKIAEIDLAI